jgi:acyl-CoA thioesterase YciA
MMDLAADNVASRRSAGRAVTVAIDAATFHHPVHVDDELSVYAKVTSVDRSSVKIVTEAWQRDRDNERTAKVTEASFNFVAIDELGKPRRVPPEKTP